MGTVHTLPPAVASGLGTCPPRCRPVGLCGAIWLCTLWGSVVPVMSQSHLVCLDDCPPSKGLAGGQCLPWGAGMQSVSHCSSLQPGHIPSWGDSDFPRSRATGLEPVRPCPHLGRLVSSGHAGGNICVPHHVDTAQGHAAHTVPSLLLCNLFVLTSLRTTGEERAWLPFPHLSGATNPVA